MPKFGLNKRGERGCYSLVLGVAGEDEGELAGYQSATSPSSNNYQVPNNRMSLPPQHSLSNLYSIPPMEYGHPQYHAQGTVLRHPYEFSQINGEAGRNSLGLPLQRSQLHSSSSSFIETQPYNQQQQITGSQYIYYPPRQYASGTLQHGYSAQPNPMSPGPVQNEMQDSGEHNMSRSCNEAYSTQGYSQQKSDPAIANGKQKPPLPRTPSWKLPMKAKRALSIADIFSIRRNKPTDGDGKSSGPVKGIHKKPNSTHEELLYRVARLDYLFNCSQPKFVAIILVLLIFFKSVFVPPTFRLMIFYLFI